MTTGGSGAALRAVMYGDDDLSSWSIFSGHFINFGYWQNFTAGQHLTIDLLRPILGIRQHDPRPTARIRRHATATKRTQEH